MAIHEGVEHRATDVEPRPPAPPRWLRISVAVVTPVAVGALWAAVSDLVQGRLVPLPEYGASTSWTTATGLFVVLALVLDLLNLVERVPRTQLRNLLVFQIALLVSLAASAVLMRSGDSVVPVAALLVVVLAAAVGLLPLLALARWPRPWWPVPLVVAVLAAALAVTASRALLLEPVEDPAYQAPVACSEAQQGILDAIDAVLPPDPMLGGDPLPGESAEGMCHWYSAGGLAPEKAAVAVTSVLAARGYTVSRSTSAIDGLVLSAEGAGLEPVWVALRGGQIEDTQDWSAEVEVHVGPGALTAHTSQGGEP